MTMLTDRFEQALLYASLAHGGHKRKGTSIPYLSHLLSVAALTRSWISLDFPAKFPKVRESEDEPGSLPTGLRTSQS